MIIVAGYVVVPSDVRAAMQPHIERYVRACRAEAGCRAFDVSFDALEPQLMRVFEIYDDDAAFQAHDKAPHVQTWRGARATLGVNERVLSRYEISSSRPL